MEKTQFLGVSILGPTDSIYDDNAAFISRDRVELDRAGQIGVKTHRHTGLSGLSNPTIAPSGEVLASGGSIPADLIINIGYTLQDDQAGETELSPVATVSTPSPLPVPQIAPSAALDYTAGTLLTNSYYYAITHTDGDGGETPLGPAVIAEREPGFPNGRVILTNLSFGIEAAGASGWRLYRSIGGGLYGLLAEGDKTEDEFIDDGSTSPECSVHPPGDTVNTTNQVSRLFVDLPAALDSSASFINLYATISGDFTESSLLAQYPIASAGATVEFPKLDFLDSSPPDVNRSYGGAPKIDPETELLNWHWRQPVTGSGNLGSGELGDVRMDQSTGQLYSVLLPRPSAAAPGDWTPIGSGLPRRGWASASFGAVASGASGVTAFTANISAGHLLKISTNKRARVRVYGDEAARAADAAREIGVEPTGDHGVQLDYANTAKASGGMARLTPIPHAANLDSVVKNTIYLTVNNFDATGTVVVAFLYIPMETA